MLTLFARGAILYIAMIVVMRALGKRQLGEFEPYELAMTILLADVISGPMESVSTPLLHGLLPVAAMFVVHGVITLMCLKWDWARAILSGRPTVVINRGEVNPKALDRLCMSLSDLLEGLRGAGFLDPNEVGTAIVEANGSISAFAAAPERPAKVSELGLHPPYEGMPLMLVMDGRIQPRNLALSGQSEGWLHRQLSSRGLTCREVCLAALDTQGRLTLQLRRGGMMRFQALAAGEVRW